MKQKIKITNLLIVIVATELVGVLSGLIAGNTTSFYQSLEKPPLSPPGWIFPVVWGILYALMGISAYLIYTANAPSSKRTSALILYGAQLFVNFLWSIVFFRLQWIGASVAVILLLLVLVGWMLLAFRNIRPSAAYLNIPYLLWVAFASYLNIGILFLNR